MLKNSKPYKANKKEYYINLRSNDAEIENNEANNSYKYSWNLRNTINVSQRAKMGVVGYYATGMNAGVLPFLVVRCPQVQSKNVYDSAGSVATIIYVNNGIQSVTNQEFYPLCTQNLDRIELFVSNNITDVLNGINPAIRFYIQLKVFDYDVEEIDEDIMPRYTSKSLAYFPPPLNKF